MSRRPLMLTPLPGTSRSYFGLDWGIFVKEQAVFEVAALINRQGPWRGLDDVEFATMTYIHWFNHRQLHKQITDGTDYTKPARFEADHHRQTQAALEAVAQQTEQLSNPGRFTPLWIATFNRGINQALVLGKSHQTRSARKWLAIRAPMP